MAHCAAAACRLPSCPEAAAVLELFEALAETPPRAYLQRTPSGQSLLRQLYQQAAEADLVARSAPDDIARLHALFDVALDHGLGGLVRDYLTEVGTTGRCSAGAGRHEGCLPPLAGLPTRRSPAVQAQKTLGSLQSGPALASPAPRRSAPTAC